MTGNTVCGWKYEVQKQKKVKTSRDAALVQEGMTEENLINDFCKTTVEKLLTSQYIHWTHIAVMEKRVLRKKVLATLIVSLLNRMFYDVLSLILSGLSELDCIQW